MCTARQLAASTLLPQIRALLQAPPPVAAPRAGPSMWCDNRSRLETARAR